MSTIIEKNGSIDDFIESLVSSPPQSPKSLRLEIETDDFENTFQILVEILDTMSQYYQSFGFNIYVDKIEGANITSYGATEKTPVNENDLKAQCLKIQTKENMYVIYFDRMTEN